MSFFSLLTAVLEVFKETTCVWIDFYVAIMQLKRQMKKMSRSNTFKSRKKLEEIIILDKL
jgi:diphthamide biosynthesis methyltransferase